MSLVKVENFYNPESGEKPGRKEAHRKGGEKEERRGEKEELKGGEGGEKYYRFLEFSRPPLLCHTQREALEHPAPLPHSEPIAARARSGLRAVSISPAPPYAPLFVSRRAEPATTTATAATAVAPPPAAHRTAAHRTAAHRTAAHRTAAHRTAAHSHARAAATSAVVEAPLL